ncbi:MAG: hypothetical protein AAFY65_15590 [Pseudomonadota bacterium]
MELQHIIAGALVLLASTFGARAQMVCTFTTECLEADACMDSTLTLEMVDGEPATLVTEFGDFAVRGVATGGALIAEGAGMVLLLSRNAEGAARASFHLEGPVAMTYLGQCEGER